MSADNFYLIRKHPRGGYAAVMGFASDDNQEPAVESTHHPFPSVGDAFAYASGEYTEYGVRVHPECGPTTPNTWPSPQPIETAPKDGRDILAWEVTGGWAIVWWSGTYWRDDVMKQSVTHWMPLPPTPPPGATDERRPQTETQRREDAARCC